VNISNDGWFNASAADRRYHAQIARFRCIENRLPMVRCVNTGMTVHIDSCGRLVAAAGGDGYGVANRSGWMLANVQVDARVTLFGRIGNVLPAICLWLAFLMLAATFVRRRPRAAYAVQES
jgi:apolipoprotein N-acyltransferase